MKPIVYISLITVSAMVIAYLYYKKNNSSSVAIGVMDSKPLTPNHDMNWFMYDENGNLKPEYQK